MFSSFLFLTAVNPSFAHSPVKFIPCICTKHLSSTCTHAHASGFLFFLLDHFISNPLAAILSIQSTPNINQRTAHYNHSLFLGIVNTKLKGPGSVQKGELQQRKWKCKMLWKMWRKRWRAKEQLNATKQDIVLPHSGCTLCSSHQ